MRRRIRQEVLIICIAEHLQEVILKKIHESPNDGHMTAEKISSEIKSPVPQREYQLE